MDKLLEVGFIREVTYLDWLANVVVVLVNGTKKKKVCIDYIDLNDVYSKYSFPLPHIYQIVDAIAGHGMLSFLDVFSKYLCFHLM